MFCNYSLQLFIQFAHLGTPYSLLLLLLNCLFNVTINDISVIYVTAHRCAGGLKKKLDLRSGSQRHRHFVGFFNVPVLAPTRDQPFYTVFKCTSYAQTIKITPLWISLWADLAEKPKCMCRAMITSSLLSLVNIHQSVL